METTRTFHEIETKITTLLPPDVVTPAMAQKVYQEAFKAYEKVILDAGGSCDADTTKFDPIYKFPVGTKVYHKNVGRDEGLDYVEIPRGIELTAASLWRITRMDGKRMYQPNVAIVTGHHINEDGSIGVVTYWWNPQFVEEEIFPENELEAV
jgi:hypothetical protein